MSCDLLGMDLKKKKNSAMAFMVSFCHLVIGS
jgi:hypothetical protein